MNLLKIIIIICLICFTMNAYGGIASSKHNLSYGGTRTIKSTDPTVNQICAFCHIPHNSDTIAPLWNHTMSVSNYTAYTSTSLNATVGQPDGSSRLCLSCHDGTIALGSRLVKAALNMGAAPDLKGDQSFATTATGHLGIDLSDDHPISFTIDTSDPEVKATPSVGSVKLDSSSKIQCTSCHDPHDDTYPNFLVMDNVSGTFKGSQLCLACHTKSGWSTSAHEDAAVAYTGGRRGPFGTGTVEEYGCESCHDPHGAAQGPRLLDGVEENTCYNCHDNASGIAADIETSILKASGHSVEAYTGDHKIDESHSPTTEHVECVDCHNPHKAGHTLHAMQANDTGNDILADSVIQEVKGIAVDYSGQTWDSYFPTYTTNIATNEYEICFRCHSQAAGASSMFPNTAATQTGNLDIYFNPNNLAHHAVVAPGPSPIPAGTFVNGITANSTIYCSDCHGDSDPAAPKGPHGSANESLLATYSTAQGDYVCFKCHSSLVYGDGGGGDAASNFEDHNRGQHHNFLDLGGGSSRPPGVPDITCFLCHGDFQGTVSGYRAGGIHGTERGNQTPGMSCTNIGNRFLNGYGLNIQVVGMDVSCGGNVDDTGTSYGCDDHRPLTQGYTRDW